MELKIFVSIVEVKIILTDDQLNTLKELLSKYYPTFIFDLKPGGAWDMFVNSKGYYEKNSRIIPQEWLYWLSGFDGLYPDALPQYLELAKLMRKAKNLTDKDVVAFNRAQKFITVT